MSSVARRLEAYRRSLRRELAAQFRVDAEHPGIERILEESQAHIEDTVAALIDEGADPDAATSAALARFGSPSNLARAYASAKKPSFVDPHGGVPWWRRLARRVQEPGSHVAQWLSESSVAVRGLGRTPGYALAFILTLGLGIGANTAIFSVVNGIWLRPLPYRDGDRLVYLRHGATLAGVDNTLFSVPEIDDYRQNSPSLNGVAEFSVMSFNMIGLDEPRLVRAGIVTGNYFDVMGLDVRLGRSFTADEDGETAAPVIILTHDFWNRELGGDPDVIGRILTVNELSVEIIGVAAPAPPYPERTEIYTNMAVSPHHLSASMVHDRVHRMTEVFARLAPGATLESARAEIDAITQRIHGEYPDAYDASHGYQVFVTGLRDQLATDARPTMVMLIGVAAFVLLIACANVANLTLARVMRRRDEWELRASLGARTWTLRRQLLIENLVPALGGALLGVVVAFAGVDVLTAYIARYSTRAAEISVDTTVLGRCSHRRDRRGGVVRALAAASGDRLETAPLAFGDSLDGRSRWTSHPALARRRSSGRELRPPRRRRADAGDAAEPAKG